MPQPLRSIILDQVGSTNTAAFERAQSGEPGPLWVVARRQTMGRGRSGRHWASERGNLYASLLQRLDCSHAVAHQLSLLAGVAVVDAIKAAAGGAGPTGLRLKWPNDILIGNAKCAGILPECHSSCRRLEIIAIVGIGINLAWAPGHIGRAATHLAEHGVAMSAASMLELVAAAMERWLSIWDRGAGFADVRAAWRARGGPVGEPVSVDTGNDRIAGTFLDLDTDGALIIRDGDGVQRKFTYGDVTLATGERT